MVILDPLDQQDPMDHAPSDQQEHKDFKDLKDQPDLKDSRDSLVYKDFKELKDPPDLLEQLDVEDVPVLREHVEPQDLKEPQDPTDPQDLKEFKDLKDQLEQLDQLDKLESRVTQDVRDLKEESAIQLSGSTFQLLLQLEIVELNGSPSNLTIFHQEPSETDKPSDTRPGPEVLLEQAPTTGDSDLSIQISKLSHGQPATSPELNTHTKEFYSNKDQKSKDSPFNHAAQFQHTLPLDCKTLE